MTATRAYPRRLACIMAGVLAFGVMTACLSGCAYESQQETAGAEADVAGESGGFDDGAVFSIDYDEVASVSVQSGTTGKIAVVTDEATARDIVDRLNAFSCVTASEAFEGWSLGIRVSLADGSEVLCTIGSPYEVTVGGVRYQASADIEYFPNDWVQNLLGLLY